MPDGKCEHAPTFDLLRRELHLFLFWHRAYIANYEKLLQRAMGDDTLGLPWWDWWSKRFEQQGIPAAYKDKTADGQPNPLYKYRMNSTGTRSGRINRDIVREGGIGPILYEFLSLLALVALKFVVSKRTLARKIKPLFALWCVILIVR